MRRNTTPCHRSALTTLVVLLPLSCIAIPPQHHPDVINSAVVENPQEISAANHQKRNRKKARDEGNQANQLDDLAKPSTTKGRREEAKRKRPGSSTSNINRSSTTMLRIQREWKDAVQSGIAFDWKRGRPVVAKSSSSSSQQRKEQPQHVWIGPLSSQSWNVWHFTFTGVPGSAFDRGLYHGRIILPSTYPAHPPRVQVFTPSGRFQTYTDICVSASHFHPETWQPAAWSVRTLVESVRLHMLTRAHEIGGISGSLTERHTLALASRTWRCEMGKSRSSVTVDHAKMIRAGWVAGEQAGVEIVEDGDNVNADQDGQDAYAVQRTKNIKVQSTNKRRTKRKKDSRDSSAPEDMETTAVQTTRKDHAVLGVCIRLVIQQPWLVIASVCTLFLYMNRA